jgi:hypothetical protein
MAGLDGEGPGWPEGQVCFPVERDVVSRLSGLPGGGADQDLASTALAVAVERLAQLYAGIVAEVVEEILRPGAVLPPAEFGPMLGGTVSPGPGAAGVGMDPDGVPAGNDLNHLVAFARGRVADQRPEMVVTPQAVLDAWEMLPEADRRLGPVGQAGAIADRLANDGQPLRLPGGARGPAAGDGTGSGSDSEAAWAGDVAAQIVTLIAQLRAPSQAPELPQPGLEQAVRRALQDRNLPGLRSELAVALEGSGAAGFLDGLFDAILAQVPGDDAAAAGLALARSQLPEEDLAPQEHNELYRAVWDLTLAELQRGPAESARVLASLAGIPGAASEAAVAGWAGSLMEADYVGDELMLRLASLLPDAEALRRGGMDGGRAWLSALRGSSTHPLDQQWEGMAPVRPTGAGREMVLRMLDRSDRERLYRGDRLAGALAGGGALHPDQWEAVRGAGRRVGYRVLNRDRTRADERVMEVRRLGQDPGTGQPLVTELALRVAVTVDPRGYGSPGEGVDAQELVSARLLDGVDYYLNFQHRLPDGSQLHVRVELADPAEEESAEEPGQEELRPMPATPIVLPARRGSMALYARWFARYALGLGFDNPGADSFPVMMLGRDLMQRGTRDVPDGAAYRYWRKSRFWRRLAYMVYSAEGLPVAPLTGFHDWHVTSLWDLMSGAWDLKPSGEAGPAGRHQWRRTAERADRVHVASLPAGLINGLLNSQFPEISQGSGFGRAWAGDVDAAHRAAILRQATTWTRMDWELSRSLDEFIGQLFLERGLERYLPPRGMRDQDDDPQEEGFWRRVQAVVEEVYRVWGMLAGRLGAWGDGTVAGAARLLRTLAGAEGPGGELSPELLIGLLVLFWALPEDDLQSQDLPLQALAAHAASVVGRPEGDLPEGVVAAAAARIGRLAPLVLMPALRSGEVALGGLRIAEVHQRARELRVSLDSPQVARQFEYVGEEARQAGSLGTPGGEGLAPWLYAPPGSAFWRPRLLMARLLLSWGHDLGVLPPGGVDPDLMRSFEITMSRLVYSGEPPGTIGLGYAADGETGPWQVWDALYRDLFMGGAGLRQAMAGSLLADAAFVLAVEEGATAKPDYLLEKWIEKAAGVVTGSWSGNVPATVGLISGVSGWAFGSVIRSGYYGDGVGQQLQRGAVVVRLLGAARELGLWQPGGPPPGEADLRALELVAWLADDGEGFGDARRIADLIHAYARAGLNSPLDLAGLASDLDGSRAMGDYSPERLELLGQVAAALGGHQQARQALEQDQPAGWHAALGRLTRELTGIAVDEPPPDGLPLPGTAPLQDVTSLGELLDHLERLANPPYDPPSYSSRDVPQLGAGEQRPEPRPDYDNPPDDAELHQAQYAWARAEDAVRAAEEQAGGAETSSGPPAWLAALRQEAGRARLHYLTVAVNGLRQSRRLPPLTASDVLQASDGLHARNDRDLIHAIAAVQDPAPHHQEHGTPGGGHDTIAHRGPGGHPATRPPSLQAGAPVQGAGQAPAPLRVSLADPGTVDQAARAALTLGLALDPAAFASQVRDLGAQLAGTIGGLHHGPLPAGHPIEVSSGQSLPTAGDTMITQEAVTILGHEIVFTWQTPQGEHMSARLCPPGPG